MAGAPLPRAGRDPRGARRLRVAGACAAALALAGCGGGRLSHGDYVRRADAVCRAYDAKVQLLTRPKGYDGIVSYVDRTLPLYVAALDKLKALSPAAGDDAAVKAWLRADARVVTEVRRLRDAAMKKDPAATNDASTAVQAASLASRRAASALGLQVCSQP
ncbi:MAG: hypothetical protein JOZ56_09185 [Actinobacteria bacterium]|nr:hypothetical protein [Actinomycetota bacterium]MBV8563248.1 hypothetical protein [Actinomycetota bacterium]